MAEWELASAILWRKGVTAVHGGSSGIPMGNHSGRYGANAPPVVAPWPGFFLVCGGFSQGTAQAGTGRVHNPALVADHLDGWMNQAYSRLSTTHGHITDCKLLVCMYWTRLVLVRPVFIVLAH